MSLLQKIKEEREAAERGFFKGQDPSPFEVLGQEDQAPPPHSSLKGLYVSRAGLVASMFAAALFGGVSAGITLLHLQKRSDDAKMTHGEAAVAAQDQVAKLGADLAALGTTVAAHTAALGVCKAVTMAIVEAEARIELLETKAQRVEAGQKESPAPSPISSPGTGESAPAAMVSSPPLQSKDAEAISVSKDTAIAAQSAAAANFARIMEEVAKAAAKSQISFFSRVSALLPLAWKTWKMEARAIAKAHPHPVYLATSRIDCNAQHIARHGCTPTINSTGGKNYRSCAVPDHSWCKIARQ